MGSPDFERARAHALHRLERELPPELRYHSLAHTRDEVVPAAEHLAALEGVSGEPLLLLRTAAYYHDIGFVERREGHEAAGVEIARAALAGFGYTGQQIALIAGMIMATRLPQVAAGPLERLLADADLDVLGRQDFWERNRALRAELAAFGSSPSEEEWLRSQLHFLESHQYWTGAARLLRDPGKRARAAELRAMLAGSRPA